MVVTNRHREIRHTHHATSVTTGRIYALKQKGVVDYLSLPTAEARPMMTEASADFTCELASVTSSFRHGNTYDITICSRLSAGRL